MPPPARLQGRQIVCVGFADWETDLWTNQQHLMSRLARENRVLFVESLGLRRPQLAGRDLARIARRLRKGLRAPREVDGVYVLSPLVVPLHAHRAVRALNRRLLRAQVRRAARRVGIGEAASRAGEGTGAVAGGDADTGQNAGRRGPILWAYVPQAEALIDVLQPSVVVYHCVDDAAAVDGIDAESFRAAERRYVARADLVLASAPALAARMRELSRHVLYAPNVADTALFARALEPGAVAPDPAVAALPPPRIVFTGAVVAAKLDLALLAELARLRPDWSLALVGPVGPGDPRTDVSPLRALPNVHLLGPRAYERLPAVLCAADAGLIPYAINAITNSVFPMKVYEYLAAGLPVVATPLPALAGVSEVATAADAAGIARLLERELAADTPQRRMERSRAAAAHSWERRLEEIAAAAQALPARTAGLEAGHK